MLNWLFRLYFENISLWGYVGGGCFVPTENIKGASNWTLLLDGVSLQLEAERDTLAFKGHCKFITQYVQKSTVRQN